MKNVLRVEDGAIVSPGGGSGSSSVTYSTTEQEVGTWIDGSTLYQITITGASHTGMETIDISDLGANMVIMKDGFIDIGTDFLALNEYIGGSNYTFTHCKTGSVSNYIAGYTGTMTITILYTKGA